MQFSLSPPTKPDAKSQSSQISAVKKKQHQQKLELDYVQNVKELRAWIDGQKRLSGDLIRTMLIEGHQSNMFTCNALLDIARRMAKFAGRQCSVRFDAMEFKARSIPILGYAFVFAWYCDNPDFRAFIESRMKSEEKRRDWRQIVDDAYIVLILGNPVRQVLEVQMQNRQAAIKAGRLIVPEDEEERLRARDNGSKDNVPMDTSDDNGKETAGSGSSSASSAGGGDKAEKIVVGERRFYATLSHWAMDLAIRYLSL